MELTEYLGRTPTAAETAVFEDQKARLVSGIFENPILAQGPVDGVRFGPRQARLVTTLPRFEPEGEP